MKHRKLIAQQVKEALKANGWSVYKLAQESKVQITPIQSILRGDKNYTIDTLAPVCEALQINKLNL